MIGLPEAARHLGVPVNVLRSAMRAKRIPAPQHVTATTVLSAEWLAQAEAAVEASPKAFSRASAQKVPPFARYRGTSAWRKYHRRVREYTEFRGSAEPTP